MGLTEQSEKKKSTLSFDLTSIRILHHHTTGDDDDTAILTLFSLSKNHPNSGQDPDYYLFISVITPPKREATPSQDSDDRESFSWCIHQTIYKHKKVAVFLLFPAAQRVCHLTPAKHSGRRKGGTRQRAAGPASTVIIYIFITVNECRQCRGIHR